LILTKPLGSGVMTTAIKKGVASQVEIEQVTELMTRLNRQAGEVFARNHSRVHALTDVTGFGLLGHLSEMLDGAGLSADLEYSKIPILPAARQHAEAGVMAGGSKANLESVRMRLETSAALSETDLLLLADAQTSGGLLASVHPNEVEDLLSQLHEAGVEEAVQIGHLSGREGCGVQIRS